MDDDSIVVLKKIAGMDARRRTKTVEIREGPGMIWTTFRRLSMGSCVPVLAVFFLAGCGGKRTRSVALSNETLGPMTIAVAPALNVSGSVEIDVNRAADVMAGELSYVDGIQVIPVNRVLAILGDQRKKFVESPGHALEIAKRLGADGVLVFAITEYDAYEPPIIGITAQVFGTRRDRGTVRFDPVSQSRLGSPWPGGGRGASLAPLAQAQRILDASHERVRSEIERFASSRNADESPLGWRKYVASQQLYLRFCCHETIRSLVTVDRVEAMTGDAE